MEKLDELRVESGWVRLTQEQERVTGLRSPVSLELLLQDPLIMQERMVAREAELRGHHISQSVLELVQDGDNRVLPGDKIEEAFLHVEEKQRVIKGIVDQLASYVIDEMMVDVPITEDHDG